MEETSIWSDTWQDVRKEMLGHWGGEEQLSSTTNTFCRRDRESLRDGQDRGVRKDLKPEDAETFLVATYTTSIRVAMGSFALSSGRSYFSCMIFPVPWSTISRPRTFLLEK